MKHISKKSAFLFIVLFVVFPIFAQVNKNTSSFVLIREMQHNLESGFYTLVLNQADQMDKNYPDSRYSDRVLVYRSECYYALGMRKLALATLESCPDMMSVNYFYGRLYLDQNNYEKACKYFEKAFAQSKKQDKEQYFSPEAQKQRNFLNAIYYAEVLEQLKDYPKAVGVTLDLIKNAGYFYDGGRATSLLCELFYELGRQDRVCEVYEKIEGKLELFDDHYRRKILLTSGISYDSLHKNEQAKVLFEKIMEQNSDGELLSSEEIANFWLRMGIDSYNRKDFSDSERCLKVARENASAEILSLVTFYDSLLLSRTSRKDAIKLLESGLENSLEYRTDYEAQLCIFYYEENDNSKVILYGKKVFDASEKASEAAVESEKISSEENPENLQKADISSLWNLAVYYYSKALETTGQISEAYKVLGKINSDAMWFRSTKTKLAKQGLLSENKDSYESIYRDNSDSMVAFENYIIEMISNSDGSFAQDKAQEKKLLALKDGLFYQGLGYYLTSSWNSCISSMNAYIEKADAEQDFVCLARYYIAYSYYELLKNEEAYNGFALCSEELDEAKYPILKYKANDYACQCALSLYAAERGTEKEGVWRENAILSLEKAEKANVPLEEKLESVLLLTKFYVLGAEYDKADTVLKNYASTKSGASLPELTCSMELASVYGIEKKFEESSSIYSAISSLTYSDQRPEFFALGEKAMLQNGLLYFENTNWEEAQSKFAQYRRDYVGAKNYGSVCYYNACCLKELDNPNLAIILLQESLNYPLEPAVEFRAMYELMKVSRDTKDYEKSINIARRIMKKFPEQSKEEKISAQIKEISLLASGETEKTASLLNEYISNDLSATEKGRRCGVELAKIYIVQEAKRDEGNKILESIISQQKNMDLSKEADVLADSYSIMAQQLREQNFYQAAASEFLNAAKTYARYDTELAAKAMYGAIESFDNAKLYSDGLQTYKTMKAQFSSSVWTQRALSIVGEYLGE